MPYLVVSVVLFVILGAGLHVLYVCSNPKVLTLLAISLEKVSSFMIDLELICFVKYEDCIPHCLELVLLPLRYH